MSRKKDKPRKPPEPPSGFSRRDFLRGAGVAVSSGLLVTDAAKAIPQAGRAQVLGPGPVPFSLRINGKAHDVKLEPRVTLLDALRNHLDLTGSKKVCDRATCGACTVLLNGNPVYSCSVLAIEAQGAEITTIEGLGSEDKLHPVMAAFVEHDAQQCGFCTPGFVLACKAFLDRHPNPTLADAETGLGGNLCRCGTYVGVRHAVLDAAKRMKGGKANA